MADLIENLIQKEVVEKLDNTMRIKRVEAWADNVQRVQFCNIKWLRLYSEFLEGQLVVGYDEDNWVVIQTETPLEQGQELSIKRPLFFHGTPLNTIEEWHNFANDENTKLPFIWLKSPSRITNKGYKSPFKYDADVKLYFVHYSDWLKKNNDRVNNTIQPLNALKDALMDRIDKASPYFMKLENRGTSKDFPKFGKESAKGIEKTYFNSTLAGVMLDLQLKIKKDLCKCAPPITTINIFDETFDNNFE